MYNSCHAREAEGRKKVKVPCLRVLTLAAISIIEFQTNGGVVGMKKGENLWECVNGPLLARLRNISGRRWGLDITFVSD